MICSITALCLFAACEDNSGNKDPGKTEQPDPEKPGDGENNDPEKPGGPDNTDPVDTSVTYTFVIGEEKVKFTVTQKADTTLSYTYGLVNYTDEWFSDEACTVSVSKAAGETMTVYTSATDKNVRVIFNTGSGSTNGQYAKRKGVVLPAGPELAGRTFIGWEYDGKTYNAGETFALENIEVSLVEFVAKFNADSYRVTYKSEGQEDVVVTQEHGSAVAAGPERKGYDFAGWVDEKGNTVTVIEGEITLTATWQVKTYSVTVDGVEQKYEWNKEITLGEVSRPGYDFAGWEKSVDGGAFVAVEGNKYIVGNDADYNAKKIVLRPILVGQSLRINIVGGVGASYAEIPVGENLFESLKSFQPANFSGWFYDAGFTQAMGRNDTMPADSITVYASTGKTYTVTFVNGGETTQKTFKFNTEFTAADDAVREGYAFAGWYTEEEGGERVTGVFAEDITVYAHFVVGTFTVTFDPSSGEGSCDDIIGEYGEKVVLPDGSSMSREYATFVGWKDANGTVYAGGDEYTIVGDATLYAVWDVVTVTVTLYDWDEYVIWTGEVEAGKRFDEAHSALALWRTINEFENFTYSDSLNTRTYTLNDGDYITDEVPVIEAHAVYMNRYTNTELVFPRLSNLVFKLRTDAGHTNEYFISGKNGTFTTDPTKSNLEKMFVGTGFGTDLHLPTTYQGKLVTAIPAAQEHYFGAFSVAFAAQPTGGVYDPTAYKILNSVYIPSAYQFIGTYSFAAQPLRVLYIGQNSAITELIDNNSITGSGGVVVSNNNNMTIYGFPRNLKRIGAYGFQGHSVSGDPDSFAVYDDEMNRITELPSSITYLGSNALKGVDIFEKVDLSNVTYIGTALFDGKENLREVILGNKITSIPNYCFRGSYGFTSIHIPAQITSIGAAAFMVYKGDEEKATLTQLTFAPNSKLKTIYDHAFYLCPIQELIFPEGLETIEDLAFGGNTNYEGSLDMGNKFLDWLLPLSKVYFPDSLKTIGAWAFSSTSISTIEWGSGLKTIGAYAFYDTPNLKHITIPDTLTEIAEGTFKKRYAFEYGESDYFTLTIPKNIQTIGKNAFHNFKNITGLEFAEDCVLTRLEGYAFGNCLNVSGELRLPSKLEYIGGDIFSNMGSKNIADDANPCASKITKLYIPASVTQIAYAAFKNSLELEEIVFEDSKDPNAQLIIDGNSFAFCTKLKSVSFPCQLVQTKGASMLDRHPETQQPYYSGSFAYCESLTSITFRGREGGGDSELHIVSCMFEGCYNVANVYIGRDTEIIVDNTNGSVIPEIAGQGASMLLRHSSGKFKVNVISAMMNTYRPTINRWCAAAGGTKNVVVWKP